MAPVSLYFIVSTLLLLTNLGLTQESTSAPTLSQFTYKEVVIGSNAVLECAVTNKGTRDLFWFFNPDNEPGNDGYLIGHGEFADTYKYTRFNIESSAERGLYNLKINNVQVIDAGLYTCTMADSGLTASFGRLKVSEPTAPVSGPLCSLNKLKFKEGEIINGSCVVSPGGITSSTLQWFDGRGISVTVRQKDESVLHRNAHARDDGKKFKCRETHRALQNHRDCVTGSLEVLHKPLVVFYPADKTVELGSNATLTCRTTANPVVNEARIFINDSLVENESLDPRFNLTIVDTKKGKDLFFTINGFQKQDYFISILCQAWNEEGERNVTTWFQEPLSIDDTGILFILGVDLAALFGLVILAVCILSCKPVGAKLFGPCRDKYRSRRRDSHA